MISQFSRIMSQSNHFRYKIYKNKLRRMFLLLVKNSTIKNTLISMLMMQKPHGRVLSILLALSVVNCPSQID